MQEIVVGRKKDNLFIQDAGYIGRYIVGEGEDMHLTSKIYLDFQKPHVILIAGKRGSGKSYAAGVILEEFLELEEKVKREACFIVVDPMGIYWSLKFENKEQKKMLEEWNLKPKKYKDVKVIIPASVVQDYKRASIPYDDVLTLSLSEFSANDWILALNLNRNSEEAVAIIKIFSKLPAEYDMDDIIDAIKDDNSITQKVKNYLLNVFTSVSTFNIFSKKGLKLSDIVEGGKVVIIDVSRLQGDEFGLKNLLVAWLARKIYHSRLQSRKLEESLKLKGEKIEKKFPFVWLFLEEAHNFIPSQGETTSTEPLLTIAKQGREPGIGLVVITQMPNKIHSDVLRQTDIVFCFRITSKEDIEALHTIMQTYMREDIEIMLSKLPKFPGAAIILDDNLERILRIQVRPRKSWHAGGTAVI